MATVSTRVRKLVEDRIQSDVDVINNHFNENFTAPHVLFDVSGQNAGYVTSRDAHTIIHLNGGLMADNEDEMVNCTTPHELAHWAEHKIYGGWERVGVRRKRSVHGRRWKKIMAVLGVDDSRTHSMDTTAVQTRVKNKHEYRCDCGAVLTIGVVVHNKMLRGQNRWHCKGRTLTYVRPLGQVTNKEARENRESQNRPTPTDGRTKKVKAMEIYNTYSSSPRAMVVQMFIDRLGMTKAGASTYYHNCKKG